MKAELDSGPLKMVRCDFCGKNIRKSQVRVQEPIGGGVAHNTYDTSCYAYLYLAGPKPRWIDD